MVVPAVTPFVADHDFTLHVGDVRDVLATLPDGSVDCVVTSPPYWGLRDYGTGQWEGGDDACDHVKLSEERIEALTRGSTLSGGPSPDNHEFHRQQFRDVCGKCGATRTDQQLGLEPTPDQYVNNMVAVFREVRRVLAPHGTCWVNLGDSYSGGGGYAPDAPVNVARREAGSGMDNKFRFSPRVHDRQAVKPKVSTGLKPKDLVGIPWRVAFALQADGWYLRSDIVWSKPNPMPESVTDRPTKAHEYVFLLTRSPQYFFDQEAVRESGKDWSTGGPGVGIAETHHYGAGNGGNSGLATIAQRYKDGTQAAGRNIRSVWEIATQPYAEAHFATYPEALVERCLKAGCPEWVCGLCGKPRERLVESTSLNPWSERKAAGATAGSLERGANTNHGAGMSHDLSARTRTTGWSDCGCSSLGASSSKNDKSTAEAEDPVEPHPRLALNNYRPGIVLDPFMGSGTTALVARRLGRHAVGVELNPEYAAQCAIRLQQLALPFEVTL